MIRAALALVLVSAMYCGSILVAYKIGFENGGRVAFLAGRHEERAMRDGRSAPTSWQAYKTERGL